MKNKLIRSILIFGFSFLAICSYAQRKQPLLCGGYTIDTAALRQALNYERLHPFSRTLGTAAVVRVYFHIMALNDGSSPSARVTQIDSEFNQLVADYKADNICFLYAGINVIYNSSLDTNFVSGTSSPSLWNPYLVPGCINVFYPQKIKGNNPACPSGCGVGGTSLSIPNTFCLVSNGNINSGQSTSHEVGHCMGLLHTFEPANGAEDIDGTNSSTTADLITDTPADPFGYTGPCNTTSLNGCTYTGNCTDPKNQTNFSPPYTNLMAYWWAGNGGTCYPSLALTSGQYTRVDSYLSTNATLAPVVSPPNLILGSLAIFTGFYMNSAVFTLTTSGTVVFTGASNVTLGGQTVLLEPGFDATPSVGGLTLIRTKTCN